MSKFWTLGEKPQIVTKSPQTVLVAADTDVVLPCEATGKPKPFITWTKVSTGKVGTHLRVSVGWWRRRLLGPATSPDRQNRRLGEGRAGAQGRDA